MDSINVITRTTSVQGFFSGNQQFTFSQTNYFTFHLLPGSQNIILEPKKPAEIILKNQNKPQVHNYLGSK